jgi:FixJ family two-component response regulator
MQGPVLLLDDDDDLLDSVGELIESVTGRRVLKVRSLAELETRREQVLGCELAVLDINLGPNVPSGLDALRWLVDHCYGGRAVFLTGHAPSFPLVDEALTLRGVPVLCKPVTCDQLIGLVERR